jgi:PAS domain S-box-containing protein
VDYPKNVQGIIDQAELPAVAIDEHGLFTFINQAFEKEFGWGKEQLLGQPVTTIMPPHMRETHNVGFSRYLVTEKPTLLGKPLPLSILYQDGRVVMAEHYILAEKANDTWRFAATIIPR